ncbi:MAG: sugar ABC transporter substrate-binding protein [Spirochaetales bacterium]|nr:sugar ABC transporter substrate-binding protein [Spirochaetales bacterium]
MKKKRLLALLLCVMMVPCLMAGGSKEAGQAENGRVKIIYSFWGTPDEGAAVQGVADKFNASQDRIDVEIMAIPHDNYITKLNTMATARELPDCGIMSEAAVLQFAENGLLYDVSKMYDAGESKPLESLTFKYQGNPVAYSTANEILLLYYNKDMFDAAGVEYPPVNAEDAWTWDEFVETAKLLTLDARGNNAKSPNFDPNTVVQYGCMVENLTWQLEVWCLSNGSGFYNENGSKVTINDPASMEALQKIADLHLVHHVAPLSAGLTDDGVQRSLIAGTCAMTTNGQWNIGTCLASARDEGLNYGVAVLPYMKEVVTINTGGPNVVFSQTKHAAEAMEWIKWYSREENSWGLIETGIWMPILEKWYTDEEFTRKWAGNPNFPPYDEYKSAVVDFAVDYARPASWYYVNNTVDFNALLGSLLGEVWTGNKTAKEAITGSYDALVAAYNGNG